MSDSRAGEARSEPPALVPPPEPPGDDGRSHLVSLHIALVKKQDPDGMTLIYVRYLVRLLRYVARQCKTRPRLNAGADDLAAETFASFWKGAAAGKFPDVADREGLWKMLCTIARRKVARRARDENRAKRGGGMVILHADACGGDEAGAADLLEQIESREPLPEDVAVAAEVIATARSALPDDSLRDVFDQLLEMGSTQPEIARALKCSVTTVGRRVAEIRAHLSALCEAEERDRCER